MNYWLVKSEPDEFSLDHLKARPNQTGGWDGVRNFAARNHLRSMKVGDKVLFYHSSIKVPEVVGIATVVREAYPDASAWDPKSDYHDPKASPEKPIWSMVDVKYQSRFKRGVTLPEMKEMKALKDMVLLHRGRLSVQPVTEKEFEAIVKASNTAAPKP
ncbi:MAG TPA: EVE domain-containing protein [bacterium]